MIEHSIKYDSGAQIRDGIKTVNKQGVCPEPLCPYTISKFAQKPSASCYSTALQHEVLSYEKVARTINQMKSCLASGYPFVMALPFMDLLKVSRWQEQEK